ncbi:diaminohydroxyphosphoribosylaminopyrimidine deaminase [Micromonospora sp. Llam0]|uniref:bifunctional diaminohydroxyphosphoribosylaminopyrimidine deaminase/5-amino-6-(5-phosphoribosylamino)uracil reductase RibD n=1 Tax=Micromonospora sp. Llam0 TaxID=2485143 RepID=UPI000F475B2A|nr:bifunctional diaminohydroxyphosphoribosylaminopyrimidine deaminase/5-amino-6-(5-phosphoribosylamino)uracil reductase RibD [Micromonospora sp. Llam0]ROO63060.1 diaminohydroxyphosphoribosylaminopyrimidine deaminase [Micromonospora sp. Llam0]
MASDTELAAMRQAIVLSSLGLGTTSPNPPVGCVVLDRHGVVVGTGYHRRKGEAHAEVKALDAAGAAARGGTAVVTLEPCNHIGVTPACRQELIEAGIARVVISIIDPTSRGDGGAAVLAAHGIDVETHVIPDETSTVLGPWLAATLRRRPHLTWAHAISGEGGQDLEQQLTADLRHGTDLVLTNDAVEEGVRGGHAPNHFALPDCTPAGDLRQWLSTCYTIGSRTILAVGNRYSDELRDGLDHVDEIVIAIDHELEDPIKVVAELALPRFQLARVHVGKNGVRVYLCRSQPHDPPIVPAAPTVRHRGM